VPTVGTAGRIRHDCYRLSFFPNSSEQKFFVLLRIHDEQSKHPMGVSANVYRPKANVCEQMRNPGCGFNSRRAHHSLFFSAGGMQPMRWSRPMMISNHIT
jgi:hypothetical protein